LAVLIRQVQGKIYFDKFDSLDGWTEEEDLRNSFGFWGPWGDLSYTQQVTNPAYSPSFALEARIECHDNNSGDLPSGRYLRRTRDITIPVGVTSVRMQVRHRWYRTLSTMAMARKITLGAQAFLNQQATDSQDTWYFMNATVSTSAGSKTLLVGVESYATVSPLKNNVQKHWFDDLVIARGTTIEVSGLSAGYKAKLYDPSDTLIAEATESGGTATIDIASEPYPIVGRIKITDGSDVVLFTSALYDDLFGGDEFLFASTGTVLKASTDYYVIYKAAA